MIRTMNGRRKGSRGQALPEFAIVAPLFFLLLFGIIEAGRFIYYYEVLNNATREGARYAIVNGASSLIAGSAARPDRHLHDCPAATRRATTSSRRSAIPRSVSSGPASRSNAAGGTTPTLCPAISPPTGHGRQRAGRHGHRRGQLHVHDPHSPSSHCPTSPLQRSRALSSTTSQSASRREEAGQVLVLFAGGVLALLLVAALAFDVGMMLLERRDEQNAADAAALAGARYIFEPDCVAPSLDVHECAGRRGPDRPGQRLRRRRRRSRPCRSTSRRSMGATSLFPNFVEVEIDSERKSIFAGVIGKATWPVGVFAAATNDQDLTFPFSMLALDPTACKAIHVSGSGVVEANGNIQANSNGSEAGMRRHRVQPDRWRDDRRHRARRDMPIRRNDPELRAAAR